MHRGSLCQVVGGLTAPLGEVGVFAFAVAVSLVLARLNRFLTIPLLLVTGVVIGPKGLALLPDEEFLNSASDVGLVLLLFFTSLYAHPRALRDGGRIALPLAAYDLVLNFAAAYWIGSLFGWPLANKLILAGVMATSSTGTILKILVDEGRLGHREGNVLVALLWIEDLAFIAYYFFLSSGGALRRVDLGPGLLVGALLFGAYLFTLRLLRERIWGIQQKEVLIPLVTSLGLVGTWLGSLSGVPYAGAAFATGLVLSGSRGAAFIQKEAPYLREVSSAVFFLGFGALLDPNVTLGLVPMALAALGGILVVEMLFLPQVARLLGLSGLESLVLGSSLLARGGKSASFARLGDLGQDRAFTVQIAGVSGLLTLLLTPLAPLMVRVVLWLRRQHAHLERSGPRDVMSHVTRRILAPSEFAQRNLVPWTARVALVEWFLLPFLLGVLACLLPWGARLLPALLGLVVLAFAYREAAAYFRGAPGSPTGTFHGRRSRLPRLESYLPVLLLIPCALALVLPVLAPWAAWAFPAAIAGALVFVVSLPLIARDGGRAPVRASLRRHPRPVPLRPAPPTEAPPPS